MLRLLRRAVPAAVLLALVMSGSALAATVNVSIVDFAFSPTPAKVKLGDTVLWTNTGAQTHTSTSDGIDVCCPNGPALWNSGNLAHNATFSFAFSWSGSFTYHCSIHTTMRGTVSVPIKVSPTSGTVLTTFTVTFATVLPPSGDNIDVQIRRPGGSFVDWMTNQTSVKKLTFQPDAGTGTYQFRARLQKGTGSASGFSRAKSITVS